jgi:hypothetical protein
MNVAKLSQYGLGIFRFGRAGRLENRASSSVTGFKEERKGDDRLSDQEHSAIFFWGLYPFY